MAGKVHDTTGNFGELGDFADQPMTQISKRVKGNRTVASAKLLEETERVGELARMLGGRGTLREELAAELLAANRERP